MSGTARGIIPEEMRLVAVADDTTGALEVGAKFALAGLAAMVLLDEQAPWPAGATGLVLDLATRHLSPALAAERIRTLAENVRGAGVEHLYLKTDSTLRGPIGVEFQALLEAFPDRALVYAPAYPAMGRTVVEGVLFVEGRALAETAFAHDPLEPAHESSVVRLIERTCAAPVRLVRSPRELEGALGPASGGHVLVCDGREEAELEAMAAVLAAQPRPQLAAGPAGFAGHWVRALPVSRDHAPARLRAGRWLVVNGSLHPLSREQAACSGLPRVLPSGTLPPGASWALLETPSQFCGDSLGVARHVAATAVRVVRENGIEGLVISGGDTARAVLEAFGATLLESGGEVLPGIPVSRAPRADLVLITKAGGFGPADVLARIREEVERWQ